MYLQALCSRSDGPPPPGAEAKHVTKGGLKLQNMSVHTLWMTPRAQFYTEVKVFLLITFSEMFSKLQE